MVLYNSIWHYKQIYTSVRTVRVCCCPEKIEMQMTSCEDSLSVYDSIIHVINNSLSCGGSNVLQHRGVPSVLYIALERSDSHAIRERITF